MKKTIVAFAAIAAVTMTVGVAEAGGKNRNKQTGQFSSGLVNLSPNIGNIGVLNNSPILSGNSILSNIGVGILGTGILSSSSSKVIKGSFNDNSRNKKRRH